MVRYGFTDAELEQAKLSLLSYLERMVSEKDRQESQPFVRGFTSHFISGEAMPDIEWELDAVKRLLPGIGKAEIGAAIKDYFSADDLTLFVCAPEAEAPSLPSPERIKAIFAETARAEIQNRESESISAELIEGEPRAGEIRAESKDNETGALVLELGNGARVILKETANRNNEIVFYALARGGTMNAPEADDVSASLSAEALSVSGLGPYSRPELVRKLTGRQVSFSGWASNYFRGFDGFATAADIETLFQMIYLEFTQPKIDEDAVKAMLDQYRTNLARENEDPETVFYHEINRTVYGNHPRFKPMETGDLEKFSTAGALRFIKTCLNPGDYTFVFTGNINIEEMKRLSKIWLASISPAGVPNNSWIDPGVTRPGKTERKIYKGKEEQSMVFLGWFGPGIFTEEKSQTAAALSEYLDIVLTEDIREKLGGVYSIFAQASVGAIPRGEQSLSVYFYCDPRRAEELSAAVQARIALLATEDPEKNVFDESIEALLKEYERSMESNSYIAQSYANSTVLYNAPLGRLLSRPGIIRAIRPAQVQAMCRELLSNGPAQVILYPEGWQ
jgi:zinc protease